MENERRATPAPWAVDEDEGVIYYDDADVMPTVAYVHRENTSQEQWQADARLIAAAPELFQALARLVNAHLLPSSQSPTGVLIDVPSALEAAISVLNKAAGFDMAVAP